MKNILIIGSNQNQGKNDASIIAKLLSDKDLHVTHILWEDLYFYIRTNKVELFVNGVELSRLKYDLVVAVGWYKSGANAIYRDIALSTAEYLKHNKIAFWNSEMATQRSTGKLSCAVILALKGINIPETKYSLNGKVLAENTTVPAVIKASQASRGESNFLVLKNEEVEALLVSDTKNNKLLAQPFMPNEHDLRVICFGGKPSLILKRSRSKTANTHMNNTSQGGSAKWLQLNSIDPKLLTISEKVCTIMNREMAGIDFIPDETSPCGYACLEVNAIPQLTSGHDVELKLTKLAEVIKSTPSKERL